MTTSTPRPELTPYLAAFERRQARWRTNGGSPWTALRRRAMERFVALGFPTPRQEAWRNTSLAPLVGTTFDEPEASAPPAMAASLVNRLALDGCEAAILVFVNGRFAPELSRWGPLPKGVRCGSLAAAMTEDDPVIGEHLGRHADAEGQALVALNTALMDDGLHLAVEPGVSVEGPIHALHLTTPEREPIATHPRSLIVLGAGARLTLVETYAGPEGAVYFCNPVTEIVVGEGATLDHYRLQMESEAAFHVGAVQLDQAGGSVGATSSISVGGRLARHDIGACLAGEGIVARLKGLYLVKGAQHVDHHTFLDHAEPRCDSYELYKGILADQASGVFAGRIRVRPGAQKTDAKQSNRGLLLSEEATLDSQPQLEIYADDVKCTHGATIGQFDPQTLYYLRTRGIAESEARALLTFAFANEMIEQIEVVPLRERLERLVQTRFQGVAGGN